MGRPPIKQKDKRDTDIRVRVNKAELTAITAAAERDGLQVSTWLRMIGLKAANGDN
ncbi:MAG: hypothetical protein JXQ99_21200 [Hyphomicrobiaceae bacterium]